MLHCVALMMYPRLQTSPSRAWRLHRRPEYLHGMLSDGQSRSLRYQHGMSLRVALIVQTVVLSRPSLAWRLHRRPQHLHGVLGDGQSPLKSPPSKNTLAFKRCAPASQQSSSIRYHCCTLPRVALIVQTVVLLRPSLAWRPHRRPQHLHGVLGDGQSPPSKNTHAFKRCAPASQQSSSIRYHCCSLPRVALIVQTVVLLRPSLAWRPHRRPQHLHGVLGDGQSPPSKNTHAFKRCAPASHFIHTLPLLHLASCCTDRANSCTFAPFARMATAQAAAAPPWCARRWTVTAMQELSRLQALCTCKSTASAPYVTNQHGMSPRVALIV